MRSLIFFLIALQTGVSLAEGPPDRWMAAEKPWDRGLGTHRAVVKVLEVPSEFNGVTATMEWRRPDRDPAKKAVIVHDLKTGRRVANVDVEEVTNERGRLVFEPVSGPGDYAVYFLPAKIEGGAFPVGKYLAPEKTADDLWHREHGTASGVAGRKPHAEVVRWEAISAHDAWTEMEVIASEAEQRACAHAFGTEKGGAAVLVPAKGQSVRLFDRLPRVLAGQRPGDGPKTLVGRPGEHLVFQVALWSPGRDLKDVRVSVAGVHSTQPVWLKAGDIRCLTTDRTDWNGRRSTARLDVPAGTVQPLWFGAELPPATGSEPITVTFTEGDGRTPVGACFLTLKAEGEPAKDHGDGDPQSLSRLRWLNSTAAVDDEPVQGYEPLVVTGRTIRCLGRELELGEDGLPVQIRSYFNKAVTKVMDRPTVELLAAPMVFDLHAIDSPGTARPGIVQPQDGALHRSAATMHFTRQAAGRVEWTAGWETEAASIALEGGMEFDGSVRYKLSVTAKAKAVEFSRASLTTALFPPPYGLGLQLETGRAPARIDWHWDVANRHQDSLWLGDVNAGLRLQLKSDNYVRPSVNIHYKRRPLNDPPSWNAGAMGGITYLPGDNWNALTCASGPFTLTPGQPLRFDFDLLITPFHPLRTREQWSERYFHTGGVPQDYAKYLDNARAAGANIVNIHQGNWLNPYINYPFLTADRLAAFATAAHDRSIRAKYYYTVRELSNWTPELFAFRSMRDEILMSGKGGGHPWGEEHLAGNYWQAWFEPGVQDVSFLTQPMSRLHNYYIEGLRWLCENAGCDGIYLDDISYDRAIMLRARKVLDRHCPRGGRIDLHSWNEFHEGGAWAHCPNIFMDSMPFVDRLWFGEGHHYSGPPPEHFLVEISGIPFGLMGEMLEGGGNPWLGLVHGATGRLGWGGNPREVWRLWDEFGVQDAEFIGWWAGDECPVRTADPLVKATVWKKADATLVAVANFSNEAKSTTVTVDWAALGRDPARARFFLPALPQMKQRGALLDPARPLALKPHAGTAFIIDEKPHEIAPPPTGEALGTVTFEDTFAGRPDPAWKAVVSPRAGSGATRTDGGWALDLPANLHAYLEREIPAEAAAVSARVWQDGRDEAQQWGPGVAVVWPNGRTLRTNIRRDGRLTVSAGNGENLDASITSRAPVELTIRWDADSVRIQAAGPAMGDVPEEIGRYPRSQWPGVPKLIRVGKMPNSAGPQDHGEPGPTGFSRVEWVRVHRR